MSNEKTEDDGKVEAEKGRQKKLREWLETRGSMDLIAIAQALFLTVSDTKGDIQELTHGYRDKEGKQCWFTLHVSDHYQVLMELGMRVNSEDPD
jgi:hypothetical protein